MHPFAMTSKRYVVDQNMMRGQDLRDLLEREPESTFVVPDVAFIEMSKSWNWEGTMRPSFAAFAGRPQRLVLSLGVGDALRRELAELRSMTADELLPEDLSSDARVLVEELAAAQPGPAMLRVQARFQELHAKLLKTELNAQETKARIVELSGYFRSLKPEVLKALRKNSYPGSAFHSSRCRQSTSCITTCWLGPGLRRTRKTALSLKSLSPFAT